MEKRSHRRIRDLVAHTAFKGLDANEIGCVRISIMARSKSLRSKGRIQMSETSHLQISHIQLATHGRSIQTVPVDVYGIAGQGVGIFFSNGTAYFVPPAPGSNLGNIAADKNQVTKSNNAN